MATSATKWSGTLISALSLGAFLMTSLACLGNRSDTDDTDADAGTEVESSGPNAPVFLEFSANTTNLGETGSVRFVALLTDPDGIDDVIGGSLQSPDGTSYGAFQAAADEGAYQLELTWSDIHPVSAIDMEPSEPASSGFYEWLEEREFAAVFYDQAGESVSRTVRLELQCDDPTEATCDGEATCRALDTETRCGDCESSCEDLRPADGFAADVFVDGCDSDFGGCIYEVLESNVPVSSQTDCNDVCDDLTCLDGYSLGTSDLQSHGDVGCSATYSGNNSIYELVCTCGLETGP